MNKRPIIAIVILSIVIGGGYLIDRSRAANESLLSGFFEIQPTQVSSRLGGRVASILVKEGDTVKTGQPLIKLEAATSEASLEAQRQAAEQANQQYVEIKNGSRVEDIERQEGAVRELEASLERLKNGPLPEEIATGKAKLDQAQAEYKKALAGSRPEEIAAAKAAAAVALEKYRQSQRGLTAEERAQLQARVDQAVAAKDLAKKELDRQQSLFDQGAVPKQQLDAAQSNFDQAVGREADADQALKRALEGTPPEELAQAREAARQAQAQYELVRNGNRKEDIESSRQMMLQARDSLRLLQIGSRREDIAAAKARLDQAQAQLTELKRGSRPEEIAKAKAASRQAAAQTKSLSDTVGERIIYAPTDGVVDRVLVSQGDLVSVGTPTVQMSHPSDIWVRVYIPESDLPKVKVEDKADLAFDGIPGLVEGKVESIATKGEFTPANLQSPNERARQVFAVRIRLAQPDSRVKAGMYVTVKRVGNWL